MIIKYKKRILVEQYKYSTSKNKISEITEVETFLDKVAKDTEGGYLIENGVESVGDTCYEYIVVKLYMKNKD